MIVFIDRQHAGKPDRLNDRGAIVDVDGDNVPDMEAILTARIAIQLEQYLMLHGHMVMPISDGTYKQRHERVNEYATIGPKTHITQYGALVTPWHCVANRFLWIAPAACWIT